MGNPKKERHIKAVIAALVENVVLCEFSLWKMYAMSLSPILTELNR